ncbi:hypothetical protein ACQEU6_27440 [Spirillospora sp. CA-108201]
MIFNARTPTLTVAQVFELAERVGVRPVDNIRKPDSGEYRLRHQVKTASCAGSRVPSGRAWRLSGRRGGSLKRNARMWPRTTGLGR